MVCVSFVISRSPQSVAMVPIVVLLPRFCSARFTNSGLPFQNGGHQSCVFSVAYLSESKSLKFP